jgi:hypothetical protein
MATKYLPDTDSVVRHINSQLLVRENDKIVGCFPQAFQLRPSEEYLSTTWLEYFPGTPTQRMTAVVAAVAKTRKVKDSHGFATGNVGVIKEVCGSFGLKIRVIHEPSDENPNPAYTAIRRYKSDDIQLLELLAADAWSTVVEARDYLNAEDSDRTPSG